MRTQPRKNIRLLPFALSLLVLVATLMGLLSPALTNTAYAAAPTDAEIALYDAIRGGFNSENGSCNDPSFLASLSNDDAQKVIQGKKNAAEVDGDFIVSAKTDNKLGDGQNENIRCQSALNKSIVAIYGSYQKFLDTYYTNQGEAAGYAYKLKDCSGGQAIDTDNARRDACTKKILQDMQRHASAISGGNQEWLINYGKDVLLDHFNRCWFWKSPDATSDEKRDSKNEYNPAYWAKYDKNQERRRGEEYTGNVGYLVEQTYRNGYDDGHLGCDDIKKAVLDNKLLSFSAEDDADSLTQQQKEDNLLGMFIAQGTDKLLACVAANNGSFAKVPMTQLMTIVADSIAKGEDQMYYPPHNGQPEGYATAQQTSAIKSCLAEAYGEAFTDAVGDIDIPSSAEEDQAKLDANAANSEPTCESEGGALGWILCKLLGLGDDVLAGLDSMVNKLLIVEDIDDTGLEKAWQALRNIAYMILVPVSLVMVVSTALGFDFISAYTIKRALPRLVIATVFIALSYDIVVFLVTLTNNVGIGIGNIITTAFGTELNTVTLTTVFNPPAAGSTAANVGQTAVAGVGIVSLVTVGTIGLAAVGSLGVLMSYVFVAIVGVAMAFFLLSLRQMLILFLMIMAPLAILAWIFPGNDKLWKLWWSSFSKLLLLYPLIMVLIASGRSFANIMPGDDMVHILIRLVAYVGPYFMIPAMFKFAGGAFATISGMANNKSKGLFDRQKKYRGQKMGQTWKDTKGGNRFKGGTSENLRGRFNRGMQGAAIVGTGGAGINPRKWGRELTRSTSSAARTEQQDLMQNNEDIKQAMVDDDIAKAVMHGGTEQDMRSYLQRTGRFSDPKELEDAVSVAKRAQQAGSSKAVKSAMAVGLAGSKTGFDSHSEMYGAIVAAADGDTALERALLADTRKASEGVRPDLAAPGYTNQWNALQQVKGAMGTPVARNVNAGVNAAMRREALQQTGAHAMLAGKTTQTVQREMAQLGGDFQAAVASGNIEGATDLASQMVAFRNASGSASPEARAYVNAMLQSAGVVEDAVNPDTGNAYSTDEQLGIILEGGTMTQSGPDTGPMIGPPTPMQQAQRVALQRGRGRTQAIRTRAGLYDAGGGDRTPEQLRGMRPPEET